MRGTEESSVPHGHLIWQDFLAFRGVTTDFKRSSPRPAGVFGGSRARPYHQPYFSPQLRSYLLESIPMRASTYLHAPQLADDEPAAAADTNFS